MLRALKHRLRLERLRQLWMQCELFGTVVEEVPRPEIARPAPPRPDVVIRRKQPPSRSRKDDTAIVARLQAEHASYNLTLFDSELGAVRIRLSRRMKNRLGHYMVAGGGQPAEIAMSLRHIERDSWDDVLHTLVHEMVHQWQDQHGMALDHGQTFRAKAMEVGISARATRPAGGGVQPRLAARTGKRPKQ